MLTLLPNKNIQTLQNISILDTLFSEETQNILLRNGLYFKYPRGHILQKQNGDLTHFYIVLSGVLKLSRYMPTHLNSGSNEKTHLLDLVSSANSVGIALMSGEHVMKSPVEIKCLVETEVIELSRDFFNTYWKHNHELLNYGSTQIQQRLIKFQDDICLHHRPLPERLAHLLTERIHAQKNLQLTRRDIAECLGASTETIIRILSAWTTQKLISTEKRQIHIHDLVGLRKLWKKSE